MKILERLADILSSFVGLRISHLYPSPSKFYLLRKLVRCLNQSSGMSIGLDAACANFKYRELFKTDKYVGVDLDEPNLKRGMAVRARANDTGVVANLLDLIKLQDVADVVVSTHTLASLPIELREEGVRALAECVAANGTLFINIPSDSDSVTLHSFLEQRFGKVEKIVYGTPLFMKIENIFAYRTGSKNPFILGALGVAIVLSYFLSFVEEFEWVRRRGAYTLFWCRNRKSLNIEARLSKFETIGNKL